MATNNGGPPTDPAAARIRALEWLEAEAKYGARKGTKMAAGETLALFRSLEAEIAGLVNMITVLVRRDGGRTVVTKVELEQIENCQLTSYADDVGSVVLYVVRTAAVGS